MKKKIKDRHLDVPAEANRDKHINFVARERGEMDQSDAPATGKLAPENQQRSSNKSSEKKDQNKSQ